jgi:lipoate-protein ligase A
MIFISKVIDPWINLAFEEYLFRKKELMNVLLLYRNSSSVIIGRNQNPWIEANIKLLNELKIPLIRRMSGGGTVFHDLGNTNYCVMMPREKFKRSTSVTMIANALQNLDIPAKVNSRYDIVLGDKKISGSAYKIANNKSYHHGTMLIDTDISQLYDALKPNVRFL